MLHFALNHMTVAQVSYAELLALAAHLAPDRGLEVAFVLDRVVGVLDQFEAHGRTLR